MSRQNVDADFFSKIRQIYHTGQSYCNRPSCGSAKQTRVVVCQFLQFSFFCYPPLVVDVAIFPLYLDVYTLIFLFLSVAVSVVLPIQKGSACVVYQVFDFCIIVIKPACFELTFHAKGGARDKQLVLCTFVQ